MEYVDGYVVPVKKKGIAAYRRIARRAARVWLDHGALAYRECVAEDMKNQWGMTFPKLTKIKKDETVVFAWIVFKSRKHRDRVNARVMQDPRMNPKDFDPKDMPFDCKRMTYGGFTTIVNA